MTTEKSQAQLESEHFSPYRADGKLVSVFGLVYVMGLDHEKWLLGEREGESEANSDL
jgi:hypothetical protein